MLDMGMLLLFFLPFFGQKAGEEFLSVSLPALTEVQPYMKGLYLAAVGIMTALGIFRFLLPGEKIPAWQKYKNQISLSGSTLAVLLFILGQQPYAAVFAFAFLLMKGFMLLKKP